MKLTKDEVIEIQNLLAQLGHYDGAIDGVVGPKTIIAYFALGLELTDARRL